MVRVVGWLLTDWLIEWLIDWLNDRSGLGRFHPYPLSRYSRRKRNKNQLLENPCCLFFTLTRLQRLLYDWCDYLMWTWTSVNTPVDTPVPGTSQYVHVVVVSLVLIIAYRQIHVYTYFISKLCTKGQPIHNIIFASVQGHNKDFIRTKPFGELIRCQITNIDKSRIGAIRPHLEICKRNGQRMAFCVVQSYKLLMIW